MNDGKFEQNFTWFEWGFVSPEDVPDDDKYTAFNAEVQGMSSRVSGEARHDDGRQGGVPRWTT